MKKITDTGRNLWAEQNMHKNHESGVERRILNTNQEIIFTEDKRRQVGKIYYIAS